MGHELYAITTANKLRPTVPVISVQTSQEKKKRRVVKRDCWNSKDSARLLINVEPFVKRKTIKYTTAKEKMGCPHLQMPLVDCKRHGANAT